MTHSHTNGMYTLSLDSELTGMINVAIELEKAQLQLDPDSHQWHVMRDELAERVQEIGNMIIWEFKQLPF